MLNTENALSYTLDPIYKDSVFILCEPINSSKHGGAIANKELNNLQKKSTKGDAESQLILGILLYKGQDYCRTKDGEKKQVEESYKWFRKAMKLGYKPATYVYLTKYYYRNTRDSEYLKLLENCAHGEDAYPLCQRELAGHYEFGMHDPSTFSDGGINKFKLKHDRKKTSDLYAKAILNNYYPKFPKGDINGSNSSYVKLKKLKMETWENINGKWMATNNNKSDSKVQEELYLEYGIKTESQIGYEKLFNTILKWMLYIAGIIAIYFLIVRIFRFVFYKYHQTFDITVYGIKRNNYHKFKIKFDHIKKHIELDAETKKHLMFGNKFKIKKSFLFKKITIYTTVTNEFLNVNSDIHKKIIDEIKDYAKYSVDENVFIDVFKDKKIIKIPVTAQYEIMQIGNKRKDRLLKE